MNDQCKSKQELVEELAGLRRRVAELEAADSERKRVEAALQKDHDELERRVQQRTAELATANEELEIFRIFAEDSNEGFGMSDFDGRIVYVNPMMCQLFGEEKPEDVIGQHLSAYYPQEYLQRRKKELIPALLREGHLHIEQTVLPRHGKPIQTLQSTFLIRDKDGGPFRVAVIISDITQRKRTEEALRASEELFRVAFEEAPVGIVIVADGVITKANRALSRMSGFACEEFVGHRALEFTHPEDREITKPILRRLFAGEAPSFTLEKRYLKKDGGFFWGRSTAAAVRDGNGRSAAFALAIVEDITERKRAQDALRQSHDELETIYHGIIEGILMTDIETKRFVRVNPSMCRMLGYSEEELLAASIKDIHPSEEVPNDLLRFQAAAEGRVSINEDRPVLRKDRSVFYADITAHRVFYHDRPCLLALFRDITERKRAEEALAKEHRNLKHLLRASDHERQTIAYEIHDGLAQQLAGAIMQIQTFAHLKDKNPREAAKAHDAGLTMLQQGHYEARRLIAGVRPPILDEAGVAEAISHLVHEEGRARGLKIEYRTKVDFDRLDRTLENAIYRIAQEALTNACQYSRSENISVSLLQREDRLRVEVRDWGVGFDPKAVPKSHFGLEGIRQRARLLGGRCSIQSKAGKGTRIMVELPVVLRDKEGNF